MGKPAKVPYYSIHSLEHRTTYDFYGVRCRIRSDIPSAIEVLRSSYRYFLTNSGEQADLELLIFTAGSNPYIIARVATSTKYSLFEGEENIHSLGSDASNRFLLFKIDITSVEMLIEEIDYYVLDFVLLNLNQFIKIHAGVVAYGPGAIIIPGASGAGKTTLTYALTREGFDLLSDELALISTSSSDIYPFPRGLFLRRASFDLFSELRGKTRKEWFELNSERRYIVYPPADRIRGFSKPARPTLMIFAEYRKGSELAIEEITAWSALVRLIDSSCLLDMALSEQSRKRAIDATLSFLNGLRCYNLVYYDLGQALGTIKDIFTRTLCMKAGAKDE
ncbi:MAG TPA: hypothetical protein VE439_10890 [Anaerolineae bacterium]|nr:hypothetical protein [Anaerolineae bacterium]